MSNINIGIYLRIIRKLVQKSLRSPAAIIVLFLLGLMIFVIQLAFSFILMSILGGNPSERFSNYLPIDAFEFSLPITKIWLLAFIFFVVRAALQYLSNRTSIAIRRNVEIGIAQEFVDFMRQPPASDAHETIRQHTLSRGPSVMTMGAKESGMVGVLITRFIVKIPFIAVYLGLLAIWFPKESLYAFFPVLLALLVMIVLVIRFRSISISFMESMPLAISERRSIWSQFPRTIQDPALEASALTDLQQAKTANQFSYFYKRHFRTLDINFIVALMLLTALGASAYQFNLQVIAGEGAWVEFLIMLALGQLLISDITLGVGMLTTFSRNFESIRRVVWPLIAQDNEAHLFPTTNNQESVDDDEIEDDLVVIAEGIHRLAFLSLNLGTHQKRKNILATLQEWDINVETVLTRDHFPKPLPKDVKSLRALGRSFPDNAVLSAKMRHHRPELLKQWKTIYKAMGSAPILLVCERRDQIEQAQDLGFTDAAICMNGKLIETFNLLEVLSEDE